MRRFCSACLVLTGYAWLPTAASAENCSGLPTQFNGNQFPKGNFISNFDNNCYLIPLSTGNGSTSEQGDLNSVYNKLYFNINPNIPPYELIILGSFPNARYFSIGLYDDHSAITQNLTDLDIAPLTSSYINPFQPGAAFVSGQQYGAAIHLGGTPGTLQTGCMMTGYNTESNVMDGTQRHPYMNWNFYPTFLRSGNGYPFHEVDTPEHSNPNTAGAIIIRAYLDLSAPGPATLPHVIVRDVASGCAYPAAYVTGTMNVITTNSTTGNTWQNQKQVQEHNTYANWQSTDCWGDIPSSKIQWLREDEYVAGSNPDAGYMLAYVPSGLPQTLLNAGEVMLLQFQVPTTPPTPCINGCSRSGNEQMRYMSISFEIPGGGTLASLPDSCPLNPVTPCIPLVQDPNGFVSLVVGTGVPQPSWVTPANGYTWLDLSKTGNPNYMQLNEIAIRDILPGSWYSCSAQQVPYKVGEATTAGDGLMGLYSPVITYPAVGTGPSTGLPATATPLACPKGNPKCNACAVYPIGPPEVTTPSNATCGVLAPNPITITTLTTQCSNVPGYPGCEQIVVQSAPPISIMGSGFGSFPLGLPYTGNSNFLQITDTTQGWSAGYTGNPCTVTVGEWSDGLISLIANVNQSGSACPLAAGDVLNVTVWNPQYTPSTASLQATVAAQSSGIARRP
jgi:hypothetical protein